MASIDGIAGLRSPGPETRRHDEPDVHAARGYPGRADAPPYNDPEAEFFEERGCMRYLLGARVRPGRRAELLRALEAGTFGEGFPYGDLGEVLRSGRVDATGTIRW